MTTVACLLSALAGWLLVAPRTGLRPARRGGARRRQPPLVLLAPVVVVMLAMLEGPRGALWGVSGGALALTAWHLAASSVRSRRRERVRREVAHATQVVAAQLRVGAVPGVALASAAQDCASLERAAATQAIGGDVARALAAAGSEPGREGLASLSRAWELSERTGAPIASLAGQVGDQVRRDAETRRVVQAELSGPRATARLLAFLPAVGLVMGRASGGDPVGFLLHTTAGLGCLAGGVVLACAGVLWTEYMAVRATEV